MHGHVTVVSRTSSRLSQRGGTWSQQLSLSPQCIDEQLQPAPTAWRGVPLMAFQMQPTSQTTSIAPFARFSINLPLYFVFVYRYTAPPGIERGVCKSLCRFHAVSSRRVARSLWQCGEYILKIFYELLFVKVKGSALVFE